MVEIAVRETQARGIALASTAELQRSNQRLTRTNAELARAQAQLARQQVDEERLRIARDLHDAIGHQLTALTLNLEVASHLVEGRAAPHVEQSRELAKQVLGSIRSVVSTMRDPGLQLAGELRRLAGQLPAAQLEVQVQVEPSLDRLPAPVAEVLVRSAEEGLTNAARHAQAGQVWLDVRHQDGSVEMVMRDNGVGAAQVLPGDGFLGMTERVQQLGGTVSWTTQPAGGFQLAVRIPAQPKES
jgi:signal transduction histidine kinase